MIEIHDLRFAWPGARADCLAIDQLTIASGERVFLYGPSGGGKSTLLGLLAGVLVPRQGRVSLHGTDWSSLSGAHRDAYRADHVGYIFQQFNLLPYLNATRQRTAAVPLLEQRRARAASEGGSPPPRGAVAARARRPRTPNCGSRAASHAVGRPAATGRRGAGADRPPGSRDRRRADLGARRAVTRCVHGPAAGAVRRGRQHAGVRQP